jgi:hypothetical protein
LTHNLSDPIIKNITKEIHFSPPFDQADTTESGAGSSLAQPEEGRIKADNIAILTVVFLSTIFKYLLTN